MNAAQPDPAPEVPATRWDAVGALFAALLDLDAEARAARLAAADPDVAREVASLLNAHDAAADAPLPPLPFPESPARDELGPGDAVGPYVLLEEVGRGGMGTVYRARRADGAFERTVALKIVSRGRDTDLILRRFARERAVLAGLTHPNVARLYDGGSAPDGRPYLAMEFVVGAPITGVCDARRMPVPERLRLFLQVCEAVAYAHRNLVVHRDLKPSNVFVADAGDGGLTVKLLDFGLARLLDDPDADVLSVTGTRTATPAYAAPEQLNAGAMTTQTDVFALGAMLYELLTGTRAFPDARRDPDAPPSRPSAALPSPDAAAARATTPDRLRRRLRGDLDAIVERALRAEPAQRYASPDALADDLRRHLDGLPVRARRGTRRYRATRFVRRHRLGVGLSAVFLVMLVAAAVVFRAQARQTAQERDKAEAVAAFLEDLFLEVDVGGGRGSALTVREALDEGARRIPALADAPAVQAHLLDVMARVYRSLALYPRADSLHRRAVATYRRALGPRHPETLKAQHHYAYLLYSAGRYDEAERLYRAVLAERRRQRDPAAVFESLGDLATLLQIQHRNDEAEPLLREAVVLLDRHGRRITETPVKLVESRASLAVSLGILALGDGRAEEAATRFREGRDAYADLHGTEHVYAALAETWLARALLTLGRLDDAGRTAAHAEAVMLRQQGPRHPWRASALLVRGRVAWRQQRTAEAEALVAEATGILERTYGPRSDAAAPARAFLDSLRRVPAR